MVGYLAATGLSVPKCLDCINNQGLDWNWAHVECLVAPFAEDGRAREVIEVPHGDCPNFDEFVETIPPLFKG